MASLAPDEPEEPVLEMASLAPDEPEESVLEMASLAPDEDVAVGDGEAVDAALRSPDLPGEIVIDLDVLRPEGVDEAREDDQGIQMNPSADLPAGPSDTARVGAEAPSDSETPADGVEPGAGDGAGDEGEDADREREESEEDAGEPVYTRTLAELYVTQGAVARALGVLRHLLQSDPTNEELAHRIAELEEHGGGEERERSSASVPHVERRAPLPEPTEDEPEEEVESLARELAASGDEGHDVDSPFSWSEEQVPEPPADGPSIRDYFEDLLAWEAEEGRE